MDNQNLNAFFMLTDSATRQPILINPNSVAYVERQGNVTAISFLSGTTRHVAETGEKVIKLLVQDQGRAGEYAQAWGQDIRRTA